MVLLHRPVLPKKDLAVSIAEEGWFQEPFFSTHILALYPVPVIILVTIFIRIIQLFLLNLFK